MFHRNICDFAQICIKLQQKDDEIGQNYKKTCIIQKKVVPLHRICSKMILRSKIIEQSNKNKQTCV